VPPLGKHRWTGKNLLPRHKSVHAGRKKNRQCTFKHRERIKRGLEPKNKGNETAGKKGSVTDLLGRGALNKKTPRRKEIERKKFRGKRETGSSIGGGGGGKPGEVCMDGGGNKDPCSKRVAGGKKGGKSDQGGNEKELGGKRRGRGTSVEDSKIGRIAEKHKLPLGIKKGSDIKKPTAREKGGGTGLSLM